MTTSTLRISDCGMVLTSTSPVTVDGTERRPSSSTSVLTSPRFLRLSALMPACPLDRLSRELDGLVDPASEGSWLTKSATLFDGALLAISSAVITVRGVGAWKPSRTMRVPVTTTSPAPSTAGLASVGCTVAALDSPVASCGGGASPWASWGDGTGVCAAAPAAAISATALDSVPRASRRPDARPIMCLPLFPTRPSSFRSAVVHTKLPGRAARRQGVCVTAPSSFPAVVPSAGAVVP